MVAVQLKLTLHPLCLQSKMIYFKITSITWWIINVGLFPFCLFIIGMNNLSLVPLNLECMNWKGAGVLYRHDEVTITNVYPKHKLCYKFITWGVWKLGSYRLFLVDIKLCWAACDVNISVFTECKDLSWLQFNCVQELKYALLPNVLSFIFVIPIQLYNMRRVVIERFNP